MPDVERSYKVPLYPVIPAIAIISGMYVILNQLLMAGSTTRMLAIGSIVLTLIGLPIYNVTTRKKA